MGTNMITWPNQTNRSRTQDFVYTVEGQGGQILSSCWVQIAMDERFGCSCSLLMPTNEEPVKDNTSGRAGPNKETKKTRSGGHCSDPCVKPCLKTTLPSGLLSFVSHQTPFWISHDFVLNFIYLFFCITFESPYLGCIFCDLPPKIKCEQYAIHFALKHFQQNVPHLLCLLLCAGIAAELGVRGFDADL